MNKWLSSFRRRGKKKELLLAAVALELGEKAVKAAPSAQLCWPRGGRDAGKASLSQASCSCDAASVPGPPRQRCWHTGGYSEVITLAVKIHEV